ncbi:MULTISPECIES: hypothetical protein [unclassified Rhizobium]|uniref:hypothetical protein n=1 Tax=unclassified Rhizobium TaxID=2613769 RepID=UPI001A9A1160|nr:MULTISPECIES: hypothetical protein [unclassified Rhizobium]MBX5157069.1 hypothetical protein [Rhizobium sp. NZLR8]MBX5165173.1 hypothetical protein [Rhizobium sp. NZLR4b]MBX5172750.1 hypothetical protein [Rhizobium sp. NZLR1b]MBX5185157.1 hypothetical protein [Rhizobium sp. NZLR5]MBX5189150.1 hypothetical protein [Rhizobium sp. NZLR3b]
MSRNRADQKDDAGKRAIIASAQKSATSSPTADDLITQARHARSPSAEHGIDRGANQAYGVARTHKGPFDNATAFSAPTYEHDLPTRQQLEAAQRSQSDAINQQEANRQRGNHGSQTKRAKRKSP